MYSVYKVQSHSTEANVPNVPADWQVSAQILTKLKGKIKEMIVFD